MSEFAYRAIRDSYERMGMPTKKAADMARWHLSGMDGIQLKDTQRTKESPLEDASKENCES